MGRPSKKQQAKTPEPASVAPGAQPGEETAAASKGAEERETITLRLDEKGRIREMRDETRERLRRALEASDLGPGFEPPPPSRFIDEAFAGRMLDGLSAVQSFVFAKAAKVPYAKASEVMRFDAEERKTLAPPASVLLNSYGGAWLARHGPLVEFGVKFGAIEAAKLDRAVALAREHQPKKGES